MLLALLGAPSAVRDEPMPVQDVAVLEAQRLVDELPDSRLVDDAAFEAATLAPSSQRAAAFRAFLQNYPESRYVRRARAELERL